MRFPIRPWGSRERSDEAPRDGRAGATPDPEVVAKPKRRQFSAEYRLRTLEEADRCTQPGEVGRLLRREGLYSSHLAAWRKARRKGSLRELASKKRGAKAGRTQPARCESANARSESGTPGRRVAHRAHDPGRFALSLRCKPTPDSGGRMQSLPRHHGLCVSISDTCALSSWKAASAGPVAASMTSQATPTRNRPSTISTLLRPSPSISYTHTPESPPLR